MRFLLRLLLNGLAIIVAAWFVPGVRLAGMVPAIFAGILLGLVNALVRPVLLLLTFPFTLLTLGLFIFVINGLLFWIVGSWIEGFRVDGFWAGVFGAIVYSLISWALSAIFLRSKD